MMLQLNPTIAVKTTKGDAEALIIIDYGVNVNSVWLCRMRGGEVLHFYSDDIRVYDNPMNGNGWDVGEEIKSIPEDEGVLKRIMDLKKRIAELYKQLNEPDLPSGEDDIVLDFSKPPENKKTCVCQDCKKEGEQGDILKGEIQFYPIICKPISYMDKDIKGLEYATAGYWLGHKCKDCFFKTLGKKEEQQPKPTIGAIDAKDLADFCAKIKMIADTNYILVKCDMCGCTPSVIYRTNNKTLCRECYNVPEF